MMLHLSVCIMVLTATLALRRGAQSMHDRHQHKDGKKIGGGGGGGGRASDHTSASLKVTERPRPPSGWGSILPPSCTGSCTMNVDPTPAGTRPRQNSSPSTAGSSMKQKPHNGFLNALEAEGGSGFGGKRGRGGGGGGGCRAESGIGRCCCMQQTVGSLQQARGRDNKQLAKTTSNRQFKSSEAF